LKRRIYKNAVEGVTPSKEWLDAACRLFWDVGLPAVEKEFPELVDSIAAGRFYLGSACTQTAFHVYLTQKDFDNFGSSLQNLLNSLPSDYDGVCFEQVARVFSIDLFYLEATSSRFVSAPKSAADWLRMPEHKLFDLAHGQIFYDPLGEFTNRHKEFMAYYPDDAWRFRLCRSLYEFGEYGQIILPESLASGDYFTAELAWWRFAGAAMRLGFNLAREYSPSEKILYKEFSKLSHFSKPVVDLLWNGQCDIGSRPAIVEEISSLYRRMLAELGVLDRGSPPADCFIYLAGQIASGISDSCVRDLAMCPEGDFV